MAKPNKSMILTDLLGIEEKEVDYGSDTEVQGEEESKPRSSMCGDTPLTTPNPFPERGVVNALIPLRMTPDMGSTLITNSLDEGETADPST